MNLFMRNDPPLLRQWYLIRLLSTNRHGVTVKEMADELSVSLKTVRRDLAMLESAGFPVEETTGEFGRKKWSLSPHCQPGELVFTYDEALAMCLAQRFLEPLAGTFFWQAAQSAFRKLRTSFSQKVLRYLSRVDRSLHQTSAGASDYHQHAAMIDELLIAIEEHRAVFLTYRSQRATEPVTYDMYPYGITYHRGSLYVIGYAPRHEEVRHWKVDRIEAAEIAELRFPAPTDFNLREHLSRSFGVYGGDGDVHVVVRFSRAAARYVEESKWHDSQKLTNNGDGSLTAEFDLSGTVEIKSWILSFGRQAEVLAPRELREEMRQEAEAIGDCYRSQASQRRAGR